MKLPVKQVLNRNRTKYQIKDFNGNTIISDVSCLGDALEIEKSLNNYPKIIELLEEALDQLESWKRDDEEPSFTMKRIEEFLNQNI